MAGEVKALIDEPSCSISRAMPAAGRVVVPLKAMCSRKWAMPLLASVS